MKDITHLIYPDFLDLPWNRELYEHTIANERFFDESKTVNKDRQKVVNKSWRLSRTLTPVYFSRFREELIQNVNKVIDEVIGNLNIAPFEFDRVEMALTTHNDGDFYKPHRDGGPGLLEKRVMTFVYYFHSLPKKFEGGELLIKAKESELEIVEPTNNSIVFFDSTLRHAVAPIRCDSMKFADGRFTLNGWIRRK